MGNKKLLPHESTALNTSSNSAETFKKYLQKLPLVNTLLDTLHQPMFTTILCRAPKKQKMQGS